MFKRGKRFASAALTGIMTLSLCQGVMAEEKPISIQVNGVYAENLTTAPYIKDNSVHISSADAKTLFGAEVSDSDVALREVAEKEGYTIGWDAENKSVVAVDKEKLLEDIGEFTIMDKYMDYSRKFSEDNYMLEGTFNISCTDKSTAENTAELGKITGTISGVSSDNKIDMSTVMNLNFSEELLAEMTESDKDLLNAFQNITIQYKADLNSGKMYLNAPEIQKTLLNMPENTWVCIDLQQLFNSVSTTTSFNFTDLLKTSIEGSYKDTNKIMLDMMSFNTVNDYEIAKNILSMFSDNTFTKNGNVYTSKSTIGDTTTGVSENILSLTVDENENVVAYDMTSTTTVENALSMVFKMSADKDNNMPMTFNFEIPGLVSMVMDMNLKYTPTDKVATGAPDANAQIIDLMQLILSNIAQFDTAAEVSTSNVMVDTAA